MDFEALVAVLLAASAGLYALGVTRLWRRAGAGRGIRAPDVARFALGWGTVAIALHSPLDTLAERSFAAHMVQHELLMVVAAPLLVASRTYEAWSWALRGGGVRTLAVVARGWRRLATPAMAGWLHAGALWVWHVPVLFVSALQHEALHALQHASFFVTALLFWWAVSGSRGRHRRGTAIALLVANMLQMNALGLLLTFATAPWYATGEPPPFGLTDLQDQQLGALIMWMLGGLVYAGVALQVVWAILSDRSYAQERVIPS